MLLNKTFGYHRVNTYKPEIVNYTGTLDNISNNETVLNAIKDPMVTHFAVGYNPSDKTHLVAFFSMTGYYKVRVISNNSNPLKAI